MRLRLPRWAVGSIVPWCVVAACSDGGGRGGEPPPDVVPNHAPVLTVPVAFTGSAPSYGLVVPAGVSRSYGVLATDEDGDQLTWQVEAPVPGAAAIGLDHTAPTHDPVLTLHFAPVAWAAATSITVTVEDGRGGRAAVDVQVARVGAPMVFVVEPASAFDTLPQRVTLHGHSLDDRSGGAPGVWFGSAAATDVHVVSDQTVTLRTPAAFATGWRPMTVQHAYGAVTHAGVEFFRFPPVLRPQDRRLAIAADVIGFDAARDRQYVHAVSAHGLIPTVMYQRSVDGGTTWQAPTALDGLEAPTEPVVVANGPAASFAWIGDGTSVWFREGQLTALRVDAGGGVARSRPRLVRAAPALRHLAWVEGDAGAGTARVVFATSANGGEGWTAPQPIAPGSANQLDPTIGGEGDDAWITFTDDRLGASARGAYAVRSTDGGATWSQPHRLSDNAQPVSRLQAKADGARVHATWVQPDGLFHAASSDRGQTWTAPVSLDDASSGAVTAHALACNGDVIVVAYAAGHELRLVRVGPSGDVIVRTRVDDDAAASGDPQVGIGGDYVFVAWREGDPTAPSTRVRMAVSGDLGTTFAWRGGFGDGFAAQRQPRLLVDGPRTAFVWIDDRDGTPFLYTNANAP